MKRLLRKLWCCFMGGHRWRPVLLKHAGLSYFCQQCSRCHVARAHD